MADSFTQFEMLLREQISPAVVDLVFEEDDPSWNLIDTFQPETLGGKREYDTSASDYPAGYEARYKVKVQRGGRVSGGKFSGNTMVMMGKDSHLGMGQAADAKYLDPTLTPQPAWITLSMVLKRILGSISQNRQQIMAELASNPIDEVASEAAIDASYRVRNYILNYLYGDGTPTIAQVNNAAGYTITETAGGVEVTFDFGRWARFQKGDIVVASSTADPRVLVTGAGANGSTGRMNVVTVNDDDGTIYLQSRPGVGNVSLSDNNHLMLDGTYDFDAASTSAGTLTHNGYESLLISSGTFPGSISPAFASGLDVAHHTELKAYIVANSPSVDPTMDAMTETMDKMVERKKLPPTALIAERSIWTLQAEIERENNAIVQVPMGVTFQAAGGVAGPMLSHQEHRFQRFSSAHARPNCVIGLTPETFRKFMPMGDRAIHWAYGSGPLSGFASIFGPVSDGTQLTELADAPFDAFCEFGCTDPQRNFRITGIKAKRDV